MKTKRLLAWLLILTMCFALCACGNFASEQKKATPLLYQVTDNSGNEIWLFGSIHVGRESYYPLPDYVMNAFEKAEALAVEADIVAFEEDMNLQVEAMMPLIYLDGSSIKDHISQELYDQAVAELEEFDTYLSALDMYCPALWSSLLDSLMVEKLGVDVNLGIDRHLLERAKEEQKEILEIESAAFQYQMLADFSDEVQASMLEGSIAMCQDPKSARADLEELMDLWASGDEQAFATYLNETDPDMTPEEQALYDEYNQAMMVDRNLGMAEFAENVLRSGKTVFICVGSAHVLGEGSITELLAQRGYEVKNITKTQ